MGKKYYHKSKWNLPKEGYLGALLRMLPVLLMVGIVPLIVRQYAHETELTSYGWFGTTEVYYEFFLASKSLVLMLLMFVMAGCIVVRLRKDKKKIPFLKLMIPLLGYGALCLLSALFSVHHSFSFGGGYEQFETVWVLLGYVAVVYYVYLYAQEELELQVVTDAICFSATLIGLLGTLQGLGLDFLANGLTQKLITTERFLDAVGGKLSLNFVDGQAMATMYNPNYLGVYGSFVVPFLALLVLYEKNKWRRIWHIADFVLVTVALLSSRSRAGLIAVIAALCIALVVCFKGIIKYWYLSIPAVNLAVVIVLLVNAYNDNLIFDRLKNIFNMDEEKVVETVVVDGTTVRKTGLTEIYTTEKSVVFTYNDVTVDLYLYTEDGYYGVYAAEKGGEQIAVVKEETEDIFRFEHPALTELQVLPVPVDEEGTWGMLLKADGEWPFTYNAERETYQYVTKYQAEDGSEVYKQSDMVMADSVGFENYQKFFSGRGYIWSRTIPLLKKHIFLGSGPDTFILEYPQNDYLKMREMGFVGQVMTKPHSWYLQVGVQTGVLSLLCLLVFYGWYAVWSLRLYAFRKLSTQTETFGIAALIGSIGYVISGISNDSMVVTAPVFWGMIALGLTANVLVAKSREQEVLQAVNVTTSKEAKAVVLQTAEALQDVKADGVQDAKATSTKNATQKKKTNRKRR